jgi:hypothetical protein
VTEAQKLDAPFFFVTDEPPTAATIDDDIYLTVTTAVPGFPEKVEAIDIILDGRIGQGGHRAASTAVIASRRDKPC